MIGYTLTFVADARRHADTYDLADVLEQIFREHAVSKYGALDYRRAAPKKRGGAITFRTTIGAESNEDMVVRMRAIADAIDSNPNLVDRIDEWQVVTHYADTTGIVGFSQGLYRGWLRESHLADLEERSHDHA